MKKTALLFIVIGVAVSYLYLLWQKQAVVTVHPPKQGKDPFSFSLDDAPKDSLKGAVAEVTGAVKWTSRTATVAADLQQDTVLQQGESLETGAGTVAFGFFGAADVTMKRDSAIEIIQTLPQSIVFQQKAGSVTYSSEKAPVSVRAGHLLAVTTGGNVAVSINRENGHITITAAQGTVRIGYNDLDYNSITINLSEGDSYVYNDTKRTGTIE